MKYKIAKIVWYAHYCSFKLMNTLLFQKNGSVHLGARALIELGQYLKNKYEDEIQECPLCHDFVVMVSFFVCVNKTKGCLL